MNCDYCSLFLRIARDKVLAAQVGKRLSQAQVRYPPRGIQDAPGASRTPQVPQKPTCVKRVREGGRTPGCLDPARSGTPWGMAPRGQGPARPRSRETRKQPRKAGPRKAGAPQDRVPQDRGPTRPGPRKAGRQSQSGQSTTNKKSKRVQRSSERSSADPCALAGSSARVSRTINSSLAPQGVTVAATTTGPNQTADLLLFFPIQQRGLSPLRGGLSRCAEAAGAMLLLGRPWNRGPVEGAPAIGPATSSLP